MCHKASTNTYQSLLKSLYIFSVPCISGGREGERKRKRERTGVREAGPTSNSVKPEGVTAFRYL